ncbi:MAG: hypothetical protein WCO13_08085 [Bacteroidota bacterium]
MKDPAFLLYSSDFLTGCIGFSMDEIGQYITLLCIQHQKGHLSEKIIKISIPNLSPDVLKKFKPDENNLFFNERLDFEIYKRKKHKKKQKGNADKRWNNDMPNQCQIDTKTNTKNMPLENENEIENINENGIINKNEIKNENFDFDFSSQYPDFLPLLLSWIKYKNHTLHQNLTQQQIESFFTQLLDLSDKNPATAQKIITQSISAGHRVIYEPVNSNKSPPGQQKSQKSNLQIIQDVDKIVQQKINEMPMF